MRYETQENSARRIAPSSFDTELPPDARAEFSRPKRPRILFRQSLLKRDPGANLNVWRRPSVRSSARSFWWHSLAGHRKRPPNILSRRQHHLQFFSRRRHPRLAPSSYRLRCGVRLYIGCRGRNQACTNGMSYQPNGAAETSGPVSWGPGNTFRKSL